MTSKKKLECREMMNKIFPIYQIIFKTEEEAIEYCKKFNAINEFWTLYDIIQFRYLFDKIESAFKEADPHSGIFVDINKLIMISSMIELLNSKVKFLRFDEWVRHEGKEDELKKKGISLWHQYNKIHGSAEKFRKFFQKYLTKEEKITLTRSVQFWKKDEREFLPLFCFKGKECSVDHGFCTFDRSKEKCPAYMSDKRMNKGIREFANYLYDLRSKFVHESKVFFFPEKLEEGIGGASFLISYIEYKFLTKNYEYKGSVMLTLVSELLEETLNRNSRSLLDNYVARAPVKTVKNV